MLRYLLDTSLCIRVIRDRPAGLRPRFNAEANALCISDVVLFELLYGAEKSARPAGNRQVVGRFAARLSVLPFDSGAAAHAADIRTNLERRGLVIGAYDHPFQGVHYLARPIIDAESTVRWPYLRDSTLSLRVGRAAQCAALGPCSPGKPEISHAAAGAYGNTLKGVGLTT